MQSNVATFVAKQIKMPGVFVYESSDVPSCFPFSAQPQCTAILAHANTCTVVGGVHSTTWLNTDAEGQLSLCLNADCTTCGPLLPVATEQKCTDLPDFNIIFRYYNTSKPEYSLRGGRCSAYDGLQEAHALQPAASAFEWSSLTIILSGFIIVCVIVGITWSKRKTMQPAPAPLVGIKL